MTTPTQTTEVHIEEMTAEVLRMLDQQGLTVDDEIVYELAAAHTHTNGVATVAYLAAFDLASELIMAHEGFANGQRLNWTTAANTAPLPVPATLIADLLHALAITHQAAAIMNDQSLAATISNVVVGLAEVNANGRADSDTVICSEQALLHVVDVIELVLEEVSSARWDEVFEDSTDLIDGFEERLIGVIGSIYAVLPAE